MTPSRVPWESDDAISQVPDLALPHRFFWGQDIYTITLSSFSFLNSSINCFPAAEDFKAVFALYISRALAFEYYVPTARWQTTTYLGIRGRDILLPLQLQ